MNAWMKRKWEDQQVSGDFWISDDDCISKYHIKTKCHILSWIEKEINELQFHSKDTEQYVSYSINIFDRNGDQLGEFGNGMGIDCTHDFDKKSEVKKIKECMRGKRISNIYYNFIGYWYNSWTRKFIAEIHVR